MSRRFHFPGLAPAALLAAAWLALVPAPAAGQPATGESLEEVERALEESRLRRQRLQSRAAGLDEETALLGRQLVAAAGAIQDHEAETTRLEADLAGLVALEAAKRQRLAARRDQFVVVLMAIQRLARHPPEALIAQPLSPADTVRGAILLRAAVPEIERRAGRLGDEIAGLARARDRLTVRRAELAAALVVLDRQRVRLDGLLREKARLRLRTAAEDREAERRIRELARRAEDLRDLLASLEKERIEREQRQRAELEERQRAERAERAEREAAARATPSPPPEAAAIPISQARGTLPFPAVGRLAGTYGQATNTGLTRKGITIETRPGAQVVAAFDGQVVFAGPFRGYGQLLIIEHGEGYHTLLAGLDRIDGVVGQWVLGGEPVGIMGRPDGGKPILYVELRRDGQPINPLPWLATRKGKVSG